MGIATVTSLTRHAADVISRRASLLSVGGAALTAAVTAPAIASASKAGKKAKKKCKKQVKQCRAAFIEACNGSQGCEDLFLPCCSSLKRCNAGATVDCIFD